MAPYALPPDAVWFITGCSSGIGYSLCEYIIKNTTSRVVATARNPSTLSSLPDGPNTLKLALDVTSDGSIRAALDATLARFSRIDVVVNNAGFGLMADFETTDLASARGIMDANFWGAVRITQLALPILRGNEETGAKGGLVLQMTSMGGRVSFGGNVFYHASKFALEGFTEGLAKELPPHWNIRFLCVEPGGVKTRYFETCTRGFDEAAQLDIYRDPEMPTNRLMKYVADVENRAHWADAEKVAEVLFAYVEKGGDMPLRLPLGSDAWGFLRTAAEDDARILDGLKEVSCSTSGSEQLDSVLALQA